MKTNILLIHSDQHRFDSLGLNAHTLVKTPNLDQMAAEGINFTAAFTPTPICSPARASLLTGRWPTAHGCLSIPGTEDYQPIHKGLPVFTEILQQAGYRTAHIGKYHSETKLPPTAHGIDDYMPESAYYAWRQSKGIAPVPRNNGWFGEVDPYIGQAESKLGWGADLIMEKINKFHGEGKPFFIRWDPSEPHLPCVPPEPFASMYPPEKIKPWPSFPDLLKGKPYIQTQQKRTWKVDGWHWEKWAPVVSRYFAEITLLDFQVGRILDGLDKAGLSENTLVVYSTDHGDLCGGHGMMDKHFILYDDVVRVPLIMRLPGKKSAGKICDEFVSSEIDLASTFLDAAGLKIPDTFQGISLLPIARSESGSGREDIFASWHGGQFGSYSQRMVRDRNWKYIWNATAEDELYDLRKDPGELVNLATDSECFPDLSRLRKRLLHWMEEIKDPLLNPWTREQIGTNLKV